MFLAKLICGLAAVGLVSILSGCGVPGEPRRDSTTTPGVSPAVPSAPAPSPPDSAPAPSPDSEPDSDPDSPVTPPPPPPPPTFNVGVTLNGLAPGAMVVLQNNDADDLFLDVNGSFAFSTPVADGGRYSVAVSSQPAGQTCTVVPPASGTVNGADAAVVVNCANNKILFLTGGVHAGNFKTGFENGIDGADEFCMQDANYPGSGAYKALIVDGADRIACTTANCSGGTPADQQHKDWVLEPDTPYVRADGVTLITLTDEKGVLKFPLAASVTAATPTGVWTGLRNDWVTDGNRICSRWESALSSVNGVAGSENFLTQRAISSPQPVRCDQQRRLYCVEQSLATFRVGGVLSGFVAGTKVVLQNNNGNNLELTANGPFVFSRRVPEGGNYSATIFAQPSGQTCTVSNGSGIIQGSDVVGVIVTCSVNTYTIGGNLTGLAANATVVLQNNDADDLSLDVNGSFAFLTPVADGGDYNVAVSSQPAGQACTIVPPVSGTVGGANVTSLAVRCTDNKIIWVTDGALNGNIGGIAGADSRCADTDDANHPDNGSTYRALIVDGAGRIACAEANCGGGTPADQQHKDWVLKAYTQYVRQDGTVIGKTSASSIFVFNLGKAVSPAAVDVWTGLRADWIVNNRTCNKWTSESGQGGGDTNWGATGIANSQTSGAILSTTVRCNTNHRLYCVEQ